MWACRTMIARCICQSMSLQRLRNTILIEKEERLRGVQVRCREGEVWLFREVISRCTYAWIPQENALTLSTVLPWPLQPKDSTILKLLMLGLNLSQHLIAFISFTIRDIGAYVLISNSKRQVLSFNADSSYHPTPLICRAVCGEDDHLQCSRGQ